MMTLAGFAIAGAVAYIALWVRQAMPDDLWRKPGRHRK
jgi:hypothetical protein